MTLSNLEYVFNKTRYGEEYEKILACLYLGAVKTFPELPESGWYVQQWRPLGYNRTHMAFRLQLKLPGLNLAEQEFIMPLPTLATAGINIANKMYYRYYQANLPLKSMADSNAGYYPIATNIDHVKKVIHFVVSNYGFAKWMKKVTWDYPFSVFPKLANTLALPIAVDETTLRIQCGPPHMKKVAYGPNFYAWGVPGGGMKDTLSMLSDQLGILKKES